MYLTHLFHRGGCEVTLTVSSVSPTMHYSAPCIRFVNKPLTKQATTKLASEMLAAAMALPLLLTTKASKCLAFPQCPVVVRAELGTAHTLTPIAHRQ